MYSTTVQHYNMNLIKGQSLCVCVCMCVCLEHGQEQSFALSKHSLIPAKAKEKDLDSGDNKRKTTAGNQSTDIRKETSEDV